MIPVNKLIKFFFILTFCLLGPLNVLYAEQPSFSLLGSQDSNISDSFHLDYQDPQVIYGYRDRDDHTFGEVLGSVGIIYGISWLIYPIVMPTTFREGELSDYRTNFGRIVWDKDEPFWNWFVHPISGSQMYLYYRAHGHDRWSSVGLTFISQALWEFTIEVYTEPTSFQDNYITTIWGSILGFGLENLSMHLLNNGGAISRFFGHAINPSTLLWFYEGKVHFIPHIDPREGQENLSAFLIFDF